MIAVHFNDVKHDISSFRFQDIEKVTDTDVKISPLEKKEEPECLKIGVRMC